MSQHSHSYAEDGKVGQLVGKVAEQATKAATETPDLGLDGLGGAGGGFGGGGGGGGGMDPGTTIPAGLETPVTPMNTSSALQGSALQAPGGGSPAGAAGSRMPRVSELRMYPHHRLSTAGSPSSSFFASWMDPFPSRNSAHHS